MEQQKKINILRNFGATLCMAGQKMIRTSFKLSPKLYYWHDLEKFLKDRLGDVRLNQKDGHYFLIDWETMKKIIAVDWIDKRKYVKEKFDCDDFAYAFFSHISEIFEINNVGIVHGYVYNKDTGKWIGGHFWNAILTENYGELHLHFYEPMTDKWVLKIKGQKVIMGNWEYRALSIRF